MRATAPIRQISVGLWILLVITAGTLPAQTSVRGAPGRPKLTPTSASPRGFVPRHQQWPAGTRVASAAPLRSISARTVSPVATPQDAAGAIEQPLDEAIDSTPLPSVLGAPSAADATGDDPAPIAYDRVLESADACDCEACVSSCDWDAGVVPGCWADNLSILGGVHGFKGPANRGGDSSFGFQAGFNYGTPARNIVLPPTMGLQIGFQTNYSNFEGSAFTASDRQQMFLTTGVFRRVDYGFEGGLVYDYLWDDWYYNIGVSQLRGALGLSLTEWNTVGFWFTSSVSTDTTTSQLGNQRRDESWETVDIYALYFRSQTIAAGSGEGRLFGGFTGDGDGIIGADSKLPLHNGWAIETAFTYLIPQQEATPYAQEAWNLGINLVWYPGSLACGSGLRYHRPLFDVADNGSMILRQAD